MKKTLLFCIIMVGLLNIQLLFSNNMEPYIIKKSKTKLEITVLKPWIISDQLDRLDLLLFYNGIDINDKKGSARITITINHARHDLDIYEYISLDMKRLYSGFNVEQEVVRKQLTDFSLKPYQQGEKMYAMYKFKEEDLKYYYNVFIVKNISDIIVINIVTKNKSKLNDRSLKKLLKTIKIEKIESLK